MSNKNGGFLGKLFGGLFDLNGDGKEDLTEQWLAFRVLEECEEEEKRQSYKHAFSDDEYDTSWREFCEDGLEYGIDPEDYETEEEYEEALEEAKHAWRDTCEDGTQFGIFPEDYETEAEYNEALEEAKYAWRDICEDGLELGVDPEDYETEEEYEKALEEAKHAWRDTCEDGAQYGIFPEDYETEQEYNEDLQEAKHAWRDACDDGEEFGVDPEDYETEEEYEKALEEARYAWRDSCEDGFEFAVFPEDYETEEEYNEALQEAKHAWRNACDDGAEFGVDPEDYETEEEYEKALEEARYAWRDSCEAGFEFAVFPEDYETEEEYNEALQEARESEACDDEDDEDEEIKESDYPNKRRYNAAYALSNRYCFYADDERRKKDMDCCRFILDKADTVIAANYLDYDNGFLFAQAVKDNFALPVSLPDEDDSPEYDFYQIILKIAKRDIQLSFAVWSWCLEQFLPYARYDEYAASNLTNEVIDELYDFPDGYKTELVRYMDKNKDFMNAVIEASDKPAGDMNELVVAAIKASLFQTAKALFVSALKKADGKWKAINSLTHSTIECCKNYEELESIEYFKENLFPLVKAIDDGMVQDEISEWEQNIDKYIAFVEDDCEQYAYTRKNAWRKTVPDGSEYGLDPLYYYTEKEYLSALNEEKYSWRTWCKADYYLGIDPNAFETQEEFKQAVAAKRQEACDREIEERKRKEAAADSDALNDKTVYIYCGVALPFSTRPYYYRCEDETIKIGDAVIVPIGDGQREAKGTVVAVGQYSRIAVPYPVELTKAILGKCDEDCR